MAEQHYAFQERLLRVHQARRCPQKAPKAGQLEITDAWCILRHTDPLLARTAADLQDYFSVSMELDLPLCETAPAARFISYEIDPALGKAGAYRVDASPRGIRLIGTDARAAAQASFLLEDLLNLEEAPFLAPGITDREPIFRCRMVHSGYAEDEYPNEHLNAIAHSGINAILVFVKGVNETLSHREDFNDLIARASSYGLDVYAYSCMTSRLHPDDPEAPAFYDGLYGELFRRCPGFKGVIFVGESVEFPSKDPHTSGMLRLDNIGPDGKRLVNKPNPGWFPCFDYPQWLELVKSSIRRVKPEADIVFWTYNWGYCDEADRLALIEALPTDISLQVTFEMFEDGMRMGIPTRAVDYTLTFPHPGKYFLSEAKAAARRGIPLYAMTNAGGLTWDVGVVPCLSHPVRRRFHGK